MIFQVDNIEYELIVASDIIRNGIGLELYEKKSKRLIAEIFRNDSKCKIEFSSEKIDISYEVIEMLTNEFEKRIGRNFQMD